MSEKEKSSKDNIVMQAGILAIAGIVSRIIGLLYRSPLNGIIGTEGLGFYQEAFGFYTIILLISSYSIPAAISKVISQKLALKQYRNAHRIFRGALIYTVIVGTLASLVLYFGAGLFVGAESIPILRIFAPTIFVYGLLGVLRGYFQAHRSMVQTSVSQIIEQIVNACVSIGGAILMINIGMGTMEIPTDNDGLIKRAVLGASGSALGTGAGVAAGLLFMFLVYSLNKKTIKKRIENDRNEEVDSYKSIFKTITMVVTPFIMSTAIYNLSATVNNALYNNQFVNMVAEKIADLEEKNSWLLEAKTKWGGFSGQALTISNIPLAFATAMAAAMIPMVAKLMMEKKIEEARNKVGTAIKSTMIISIPCAIGLLALAKPVVYFLFPRSDAEVQLAAELLMILSPSVIFYALSSLNGQILQGLGKVNAPIINAATALIVQTVLAYGLLFYTDLDIYGIAIVNNIYAGLMCVLNQNATRKAIDYRQEIRTTFIIPLISALLMGAIAWLSYQGLLLVVKSPRIALLPAIGIGAGFYFVFLILLKGVSESELRGFPKGYLLVKLAKKCHLLR